jgi:hypothetical protein
MTSRLLSAVVFAVALACAASHVSAVGAQSPAPRIQVSFANEARAGAVTGMVYVAISRDSRRTPIEQASPTGVPLFSKEVEGLAPGVVVPIGDADRGYPIASLRDLPAGEYWMQPFVNVYTKFSRADGKTVWMHMDQWEGQDWKRSPGNLFGDPVKVTYDPKSAVPIALVANKVIPPIQPPPDSAMVKRIKIQSAILTKWWGHPIYLGATVLLPKDYDAHPDVKYPVNYVQGHFSLGAPGGFGRGGEFDKVWLAEDTPRFLYVTLQHPSPYYDDSYGVNSENNGPYGDAIIQELVPAVEKQFRAIAQPWARMLSGGSTGGWIAVAHQVFYPDFYGGSFASCPDSVDFSYHQIVDIYKDANAYFFDKGWMKVERPNLRQPDGNIQSMMKDENHYEQVVGDQSRSGRRGVEEVRPPLHPAYQLGHARSEGREQAEHLRWRHGLVLPQRRRREAERVPAECGQPEIRRRGRVSAPGAALLGAPGTGTAPEVDRAGRKIRARGSGPALVEIPIDHRRSLTDSRRRAGRSTGVTTEERS